MVFVKKLLSSSGALGSIVAAMGCASCFPLLGGLASALGLGFLAQFEGLFINTLLPWFAALSIVIAIVNFSQHLRWLRLLASLVGPVIVLLTLYPLWRYGWSTQLFYFGLVIMLLVVIWDFLSPPVRQCISSDNGSSGSEL